MKELSLFLKKHKAFTFSTLFILAIVLVTALAPVFATHDPLKAPLSDAFLAPSAEHLCGTDALGRDLFSRIIYGGRATILSAVILVLINLFNGMVLGMLAGYFGGAADAVIMRFADTMIAFPDLILAIAIAGILGPNLVNSMIAMAVVSWTKYARMTRSLVLKIKNRDYVAAARVTGSKHRHMLLDYMLPNALPTLVITAVTDIGSTMLGLSGLSFLGFGIQPPTPEWGYMLSEGRTYMQMYPWMIWFPGIAILIVVIAFNLWGDSVRDILDPRTAE